MHQQLVPVTGQCDICLRAKRPSFFKFSSRYYANYAASLRSANCFTQFDLGANICQNVAATAFCLGCRITTGTPFPPQNVYRNGVPVRSSTTTPLPTYKLFSIKPVLGKNKPHTSLCRCDETVITRLRIGHSRMTHSYLLSRESQPVCDHCKCHLTVKHAFRMSKYHSCTP